MQITPDFFYQTMTLEIRPSGLRSPLATSLVDATTRATRHIDAATLAHDPVLSLRLMSIFAAVCLFVADRTFLKKNNLDHGWASARMSAIIVPFRRPLFRWKER